MKIRPATPADAPNIGTTVYSAFCGTADQHSFPHDFPSAEAAMGMAGMCVGSPDMVGFVAESESGEFLGSNFLWRQNSVGGVGPISVAPGSQTNGIGRALMQAVVDAGADMPGIRLVQDTFNTTSMALYASMGFDVVEPLVVMAGTPKDAEASTPGVEVRALEAGDHAACGELCRRVHGFERTNELAQNAQMFPAVVAVRDGRIVGYCAAPNFWHMNHAVAETTKDMQSLLAGAARVTGQPLAFLLPTRQAELFRWCLGQKLRIVKPMTLMARGWYQEPQGAFVPSVTY